MNRKIGILFSATLLGGALAACDQEEAVVSCAVDADCSGYACVVADGETAGVCATACADGCATGFTCGGETGTECVAVTQTCADLECGPFACDEAASACFQACTGAEQCAEDGQCDIADGETEGTCIEVTPLVYMYVAVVSTAQGDAAMNNPNPGPDLDAISVSAGGNEQFATVIESSELGAAGDETNTRTNFNGVLGTHDTLGISPPTTCDLDIAQPGYTAIGGDGGFVVVSFGRELVTTDQVKVYEINEANCDTATTERPDTYEVYITHDEDAARNNNASQIRDGWCLLGAQGGTGGTGSFTFNADACAE